MSTVKIELDSEYVNTGNVYGDFGANGFYMYGPIEIDVEYLLSLKDIKPKRPSLSYVVKQAAAENTPLDVIIREVLRAYDEVRQYLEACDEH